MHLRRLSGRLAASLLAVALLAGPCSAVADDRGKGAPEEVRRAVEAGEIKSLADILAAVRGQLPGEVAGVEIERDQGRWLYEFRVVDSKGRLYEVYVDARSGRIDKVKEK